MWRFLLSHTPLFYFTQSIWRDEAFSILLAQRPLASFITTISFEPPVYYILLHMWMRMFGTGEVAVRSLSLLGFTLATIVVIVWAGKIFHKHWLSWFLPAFFFFNPMLLYYAFEIRSYGWYMFFSVLSMYAYMEKKYTLHIIATTLGLYTHTYMVVIPGVQMLHLLLIRRSYVWKDPLLRSFTLIGLLFSPWFLKIITDLSKLRESWYFPVDLQLIKSVLGNIFLGYEGTPWYLWQFTQLVSVGIFVASLIAIIPKHKNKRSGFFFLLLYVPLILIIGISFVKPVFVNRYVIPATIAEIFLVVFAIEAIRHKFLQQAAAAGVLLFIIGFNLWYPGKYAKTDIRSTVTQINALAAPSDIIMTDNPLILFETMYYSANPNVYWYNPKGSAFPWYVGDIIVNPSQIVKELPLYPTRAFLIQTDGSYKISYKAPFGDNP